MLFPYVGITAEKCGAVLSAIKDFLNYKLSYLYPFPELSERGVVSPFYKSNQHLSLTMEKPDGKSISDEQLVTQEVLAHTLYRQVTF